MILGGQFEFWGDIQHISGVLFSGLVTCISAYSGAHEFRKNPLYKIHLFGPMNKLKIVTLLLSKPLSFKITHIRAWAWAM
jgi:hypothetical protein